MKWNWLKNGKGCGGTYECNGWKVWCNCSGWKITKPDGFTYAVEYKMIATAKKFAEQKMNNTR